MSRTATKKLLDHVGPEAAGFCYVPAFTCAELVERGHLRKLV